MSIPLDRLYHYIDRIAKQIHQDRVLIYRFSPDGSKKQENLTELKNYSSNDIVELPSIICYDQEPLNFELYESTDGPLPESMLSKLASVEPERQAELYQIYSQINFKRYNLRYYPINVYDHAILLHSELRSENVSKYSDNNFIPVYYWSHAVIAQDWFRYANHINQKKQVTKPFLIYNRAWSGTREYRLKFAEHLIRLGLQEQCQTSINPIEPELNLHYDLHQFKNRNWRPAIPLENYFPVSDAKSHYSADFDIEDYEATDIEVVLETLFDDHRLHLTEKSLRPIACGQPFILAGTHGSLEYLRKYGFKTFMHVWDERYDFIEDPQERLVAIADLMRQIANWAPQVRERKMAQAQAIAEYNRRHFFSDSFREQVEQELVDNLTTGLADIEIKNAGEMFSNRRKLLLKNSNLRQYMITNKKDNYHRRAQFLKWLKQARQYKLRRL